MSKLRTAKDHLGRQTWMFWCPGCDCYHGFTEGIWTFDGNYDSPTVSPSLLATDNEGNVCHSFIRSGRIEFLGDCTHSLAGQTVDMITVKEEHDAEI